MKLLPHAADDAAALVLMRIHRTQTWGFLSRILRAVKAEPLHNAAHLIVDSRGVQDWKGGAGARFGGGGTRNYQPER